MSTVDTGGPWVPGGPQMINIKYLLGDQNGFQQNTHGLDIGKLLQTLLGSFTQSKSFNGQMQYTNKQTGQPATCEDLKSFLQQEINNQGLPYGNYQENAPQIHLFISKYCSF